MTITPDVIGAMYPGLGQDRLADMGRDVAFDFYLEFLTETNVWEKTGLVFKGGTAVRKFHCSHADYSRISYDLDFTLLYTTARQRLPYLMSSSRPHRGFRFAFKSGPHQRIEINAPFLASSVGVGFDAAATMLLQQPQWLTLQHRPIHNHYDIDLSFRVPVMSADETVAEKLTRWQHRPLIRDLYDLTKLRHLIADPSETARMWVIKSHQNHHNPNKGPTTTMSRPVDIDCIIDTLDIDMMKFSALQFDVPMSEVEKVSSVEQMLAELPDSYAFCIDETDADLEKWANDVDGSYISDVREAAAEMATTSLGASEPRSRRCR